jgi:hypothetical protein
VRGQGRSRVLSAHQGRRLVNGPPVAEREDPENPGVAIDGVDEAETPHAVLPESRQLSHERFPQGGVAAESLEGPLDRAFPLRRKMPEDLPYGGRDVEAIGGH